MEIVLVLLGMALIVMVAVGLVMGVLRFINSFESGTKGSSHFFSNSCAPDDLFLYSADSTHHDSQQHCDHGSSFDGHDHCSSSFDGGGFDGGGHGHD
jgi:hypothetical protein